MPTEAEWEYAARAGCAHAYCRRDGSAAQLDEVAWWIGNAVDPETVEVTTQPVMRLEANPWGLWDVYGNVGEWNADWYGSYSEASERDPPGPTDTQRTQRTYRGFHAWQKKQWMVASGRGEQPPTARLISVGLRVVIAESQVSSLRSRTWVGEP